MQFSFPKLWIAHALSFSSFSTNSEFSKIKSPFEHIKDLFELLDLNAVFLMMILPEFTIIWPSKSLDSKKQDSIVKVESASTLIRGEESFMRQSLNNMFFNRTF